MTYTKTPHGRSWHVVKTYEPPKTQCGHEFDPDGETFDQLPVPSCEHCLRWVAREVEKQVVGESETYTAVAQPSEDRIAL